MGYRTIFAGTPEFAAEALKQLLQSEHTVVAVYTQPDRAAGRGRKLTPSAVKRVALEHQLPLCQPDKLKDEPQLWQQLRQWQADVMVVAAYGLILPPEVLSIPPLGCLNIHASLLPRWRGAAPIQRAILAGDQQTGITIMQMDSGLDTGAMLYRLELTIEPNESAAQLQDRLAVSGGEALLTTLQQLQRGELTAEPQSESGACYAKKLHKSEAVIDWSRSSDQIARQIAAFNPWPVAQTTLQGEVVRIWQAQAINQPAPPLTGEVIRADRHGIEVACGQGSLRIIQLQLPGKRPMQASDFLTSRSVVGLRLGESV
ncbi:methionyl-tRNA formyltransferase [Ectothiorhodospiraceae bacterium BW-2]|nr:methionyl-tRNA formyltransferase [Ectothiorhodospiraceae bacterium BW-2]